MPLSDVDKGTLRKRYESWGVDAVKRALRRPARRVFASPERNEFAQAWVEESEEKAIRQQARRERMVKILMVAAAAEFGVAIGLQLPI